ncbi:protein of unknown function [Tepidibacter aestuarii]|nr:protein of unknown function [Tepidibacter aestuarii]
MNMPMKLYIMNLIIFYNPLLLYIVNLVIFYNSLLIRCIIYSIKNFKKSVDGLFQR